MSQQNGSPTAKVPPQKPGPQPKPVAEKIRESINLINQLSDIGIPSTHRHVEELRRIMNDWIRDPFYVFSGKLDFSDFNKKAEVVLPRVAGRQASVHLRAT
jgi:hypothetical protein